MYLFFVFHRHDNIVRYYGSGVKGKNLSIFLEYMPGGSVRRLLDRFGVFEEKITLIYSAQMMRGLEFLHSNGVAHRDIKVRRCSSKRRFFCSCFSGGGGAGSVYSSVCIM